jgi:hypothetical protein
MRAASRPFVDASAGPDQAPVMGDLASLSVAHVGLRDSQACVEHQHVLAVSNPFQRASGAAAPHPHICGAWLCRCACFLPACRAAAEPLRVSH